MQWVVGVLIALLLLIAGLHGPSSITPQPVAVSAPRAVAVVPTVGVPASAPVPTPLPGAFEDSGDTSERFERVFAAAKTWLGVPYLFGGCSRSGVDCSCAVRNWYAAVGINLSRNTIMQKHDLPPVPLSQIRPGDILQFNNTCDPASCGPNPQHEGMYIGNGQMIQAGGPNVNITRVDTGFYAQHLAGALRVP